MMRRETTFNPYMLKMAREIRMLTYKALAEQSGISANTISRYEKGMQAIDEDDLVTLSEVLRFPVAFFSQAFTPPKHVHRIVCPGRGWVSALPYRKE